MFSSRQKAVSVRVQKEDVYVQLDLDFLECFIAHNDHTENIWTYLTFLRTWKWPFGCSFIHSLRRFI